ncbi:hypothetical protein C5167_011026 [Papaver somniferum]|uniref:DUF241 domain-containing protein n=1 Tax=Papaver somniferum TaxID=3469 RepID=A0A4Y7K5Z7_PAPSO|nr:uncharacterized protein LOC113289555 [Papaver somniferum]RZC67339.1 hypothetical protein C5167_011026 [Papaver somniferum]
MHRNSSHARSRSLPSISHPTVSKAEELLCRLRSSEAVRPSPSASSSSICHDLIDLNNLYECVEDLLQLPLTQQALTGQDRNSKWVDQALDESLMLVDVCGTTRDVLLEMKESVQELESALRRRKCGESVASEVAAYNSSRKKVNKVISKCLGDLRKIENNNSALLEEEPEVASIIRQVEGITHSIFESILSLSIGSKARCGWSLVSKMMHTKSFNSQEKVTGVGEFEKVEVALKSLSCKEIGIRQVQKQLVDLEISIQGFEDGLECVFRHLMRHRVSLLNILSY